MCPTVSTRPSSAARRISALALFERGGDGLFHQDVGPRLQRDQRDFGVQRGRHRHRDQVGLHLRQHAPVVVIGRHTVATGFFLRQAGLFIGYGGQFDSFDLTVHPDMVAAHRPHADHRCAHSSSFHR
jgi:hypothetical protein